MNKKKIMLFLIIVTVLTFVGYGTYSYYVAQGEYSFDTYVDHVIKFDPGVYGYFLGEGEDMNAHLTCDDYILGKEEIVCTTVYDFGNGGNTSVLFEISDLIVKKMNGSSLSNEDYRIEASWDSKNFCAGCSASLEITVYFNTGSINEMFESEHEYAVTRNPDNYFSNYYREFVNGFIVSFTAKATQIVN